MKALIQRCKDGADTPFNVNAYVTQYGFQQRGWETEMFSPSEIDERTFERDVPIVGGVETVRRVLHKLGVERPGITYPRSLGPYLGRAVWETTLNELCVNALGGNMRFPCFIKPRSDTKKFTGFVCKDSGDCRLLSIESRYPLYASEVVDFKSEYRVYVLNGKIQNISRYRGPVELYPDIKWVRSMIENFTEAPIAYGLDVGVDKLGRTLLVEVNDALALGNYGLPPTLSAKMVASRWFQMVGNTQEMTYQAQAEDSPVFANRV